MLNPVRPKDPEELARTIVRFIGAHRVLKVIGLAPVSPPEGHAFYAFVVLRGDAPDARDLEEELHERFTPKKPRVDYWVMGENEWTVSRQRIAHPVRYAFLDGTVLYDVEGAGEVGASVA